MVAQELSREDAARMEKKTRSSRKSPASMGSERQERPAQRGRRARTLADATDPRSPAQPRGYYESDYPLRADQPSSSSPQFTLPSLPSMPTIARKNASQRSGQTLLNRAVHPRERGQSAWDEYAQDGDEWSPYPEDDDGYDDMRTTGRSRAQSRARPLAMTHIEAPPVRQPVEYDEYGDYGDHQDPGSALVTVNSVPDLVAWRPPVPVRRKPVYTRAIETARHNPWSLSRICLGIIALVVTLVLSITAVGEPSQPLMAFFNAQSASANAQSIASLVRPLTQGRRIDQYDSVAQYNTYWGAACSAAVLAEVLTAWGVRDATIGHMIDELGPTISPNGGLLSYSGFQKVAAKHGLRSEFRENLTYKQMLYIVNTLHLPLIVNVRISYGFYHFFSGGHFLVVTAGDSQGLRLVDSSLYYVNYMPLSVFNSMFTGRTVLLVPSDYTYTLPK
jgi:predicted double-glycine peptidase